MDAPLDVVIRNSPPWWIPIIAAAAVAAVFQFVAVFWAYRLASRQAAKAQREQQEYNEKIAREGALRTILMNEVPSLNSFLAKLHIWIERTWKSKHIEWYEVESEMLELIEFAKTITRDPLCAG